MPLSNQSDLDAASTLLGAVRAQSQPAAQAVPQTDPNLYGAPDAAPSSATTVPAASTTPPTKATNSGPFGDAPLEVNWGEMGRGFAEGIHKATDGLAEFLATHLGGTSEGQRVADMDAQSQEAVKAHLAAIQSDPIATSSFNAGVPTGQTAIIVPSMMGINGLTRAGIGAATAARPILQSAIDLAGGAAQGGTAAKMTGGDPVTGAITGGAVSGAAQGLGALSAGLAGDSALAKAMHSKLIDAVLGFKFGLIVPALKQIAAKYGSGVSNALSEMITAGNTVGAPSGGAGVAVGDTVNHLLTPPTPSTEVPATVSGLLPQGNQRGSSNVPASVSGLMP